MAAESSRRLRERPVGLARTPTLLPCAGSQSGAAMATPRPNVPLVATIRRTRPTGSHRITRAARDVGRASR
jgi:hypothetical protein